MCLAVPGKIESISGEDLGRVARVSFSGVKRDISLAYVPEAQIGDYVLVHVGFAISRVDPAEADQVFEYLRQMDESAETDESSR